MRSVSDLTELIASLGPLPWGESAAENESGVAAEGTAAKAASPESEPGPDRYKCRNCGREADADVELCPHCSSPNLRPLHF